MIPTAISQILEQVINAIISVVAASVLFKVGLDTAKVYGKDGYAQAFGAAGGTIGTGSGAFAALLFVLVLFLLYRPTAKRRIAKDRSGSVDSYLSLIHICGSAALSLLIMIASGRRFAFATSVHSPGRYRVI